jgi:GNAT superfamily N-acetyltransferase
MNIRNMMTRDLDFAAACTQAEGWSSETRDVFEGFILYDPEGCFIAEEFDRPVGICVATAYESSGFIGELIVKEEVRGRSIGVNLLQQALAYLQSRGVRSIYLDSVEAVAPLYERAGFRKICFSLRFAGTFEGRRTEKPSSVRAMRTEDLEIIFKIDRDAFGEDRAFFLKRRFSLYPEFCKIFVQDGAIQGYIMGMMGNGEVSVGPWVVRREAERPLGLLESVALEAGPFPLRIGILETNTAAVRAVEFLRFLKAQTPSWRMVLGEENTLGMSTDCFAIGSAAKG